MVTMNPLLCCLCDFEAITNAELERHFDVHSSPTHSYIDNLSIHSNEENHNSSTQSNKENRKSEKEENVESITNEKSEWNDYSFLWAEKYLMKLHTEKNICLIKKRRKRKEMSEQELVFSSPKETMNDREEELLTENQVENDIFESLDFNPNSSGSRASAKVSFFQSSETLLDEKVYICSVCNKTFGKKKNLNNHVREVHDQVKNHFCPVCLKGFFRKSYLIKHSCSSRVKSDQQGTRIEPDLYPIVEDDLLCKQELDVDEGEVEDDSNQFDLNCKQEYNDQYDEEDMDAANVESSYQELSFQNDPEAPPDEDLDYTVDTSGLVNCPLCEKQFKMKKNVNLHIREVHVQEKNHFCPICNKGFFKNTYLQKHLKLSKICGKEEVT